MTTPASTDELLDLDALFQALDGEPITYRQLSHWIRTYSSLFSWRALGLGSGYRRRFTAQDTDRLRVMARAVHAGLRPEVAARIAEQGAGEIQLSDHVVVRVIA